jgi:hypothetical protein
MSEFEIKDSGQRQQFESGMVRDVQDGKPDVELIFNGPMADRWAEHLTKGAKKYPDVELGVPNWTLAEGKAEMVRARKSAARHFRQWHRGDTDEDHAAAVFFNVNLYEYVKAKMASAPITATEIRERMDEAQKTSPTLDQPSWFVDQWKKLMEEVAVGGRVLPLLKPEVVAAIAARADKTAERRDLPHELDSCAVFDTITKQEAGDTLHPPAEPPAEKPAHRFPVHPWMYRS